MRAIQRALFCLMVLVEAASGQTTWPDAASVAEVMRRANNYWISNNAAGNSGWARGAYYTGNQRAFRVLGERDYWHLANIWAGANQWKIGPEGAGSADAYCCGQTYLDLYRLNPQAQYVADIKARTDALVASPAVDGWWWIDAFYMQAPVLARLGNLTGDTNYYQKLWLMYDDMKTRRELYDAAESLWFRDASYFYPGAQTASGQKVFWSRGNGWVFAGLARVMQQMPTNAPHYVEYAGMFQGMAAKLKTLQGVDGLWRSSLYDPAQYPNPETSGSGFFTYGIAWGVRNGLLPAADYTNTITLAWYGLTNLALGTDGRVGYVQNVGAGPASATASSTTDFGVGAFLLACSEIYLLAPDAPAIRAWAGPDQTLLDTNEDGQEPITLDASETEIYRGAAVNYTWWEGANQIASGITAQTNLNLGEHVVTVKVLGSDGLIYSDSMTVVVAVISPPVPKLRFDFEDSGNTTTDALAGVILDLVDGSGSATDLHGPLGSGVGGAGHALDFTSAASQGGNGPLASTVGNSTVDFGSVNAFTVTFWIKPGSSMLVSGFPRFFSLGTNGTTDRGVLGSLQLLSDGNLQPSATAVQGFVNTVQTSTSSFGALDLPANQWRFLALTYDGATLNLYGGSESNVVSLASTTGFVAGAVPIGNSWTLMLGNRLARDRAFRGWLDDVRFFQEAAPLEYLETIRQQAMPPAQINAQAGGDQMQLRVNTRSGLKYILESTSDLAAAGTWTPVSTNLGTGGFITNTVPSASPALRNFFRYRIQ